jgi:hypothetical protein
MSTAARELHLELLLGRRVLALNGRSIGRIEEICAEPLGGELVVTEFHVGTFAVLERLSSWAIGRTILDLFGARSSGAGYRVAWDKLDLSDPERPRLTCSVDRLAPLQRD